MKKYIFFLAAVVALASCKSDSFQVKGTIAGAAGETIYLEKTQLIKNELLDSVKVKNDGSFAFTHTRPEYPELYRLRVGGKSVMLAVDSLETISLTASLDNLNQVVFEGSDKSQKIAQLRQSLRENTLADHKELAKKLIMEDPGSVVAYYAIFQQKAGAPVFDMSQKADRIYYQAVATSWNAWMPKNPRTIALCQQVISEMNAERRAQNMQTVQAFIDEQENAFLDIVLKNENGEETALSSLRGKVILLDFCSQQIDAYKDYLFSLRDRYNTYHQKGLEIYQVYPDQNRLIWEDQVRELPWTTVRTDLGLADPVYATYNVQTIPTLFLLNRKGEVTGRFVGFSGLNEAIEKLL